MTPALSLTERTRLVALLGMLGSDFDGGRASAALLATRLLKAKDLTWDQVVATTRVTDGTIRHSKPAADTEWPGSAGADPLDADWRATALQCARYPHLINRWESDFLSGLPRFPRLSWKQRETLIKIVTRLRACGCWV